MLEVAHYCPRLEVSILRADDLHIHHVLDNVERLFALKNHVKGLYTSSASLERLTTLSAQYTAPSTWTTL